MDRADRGREVSWLKVFNDLKTRVGQDILVAVVDGLKGLAECIAHLIRNSLNYAGWKDRKLVAQALRPIYTAVSEEVALSALQAFATGPWGAKCPSIAQSWQRRPHDGKKCSWTY